jgi:hypothetical protein|tara:strand:- start:1288 stop:1500 length:213 start_codon:yes stop_codon:yes gene_type:complete
MLEPGDLVQVNLECNIKYFWGKMALVLKNMGQDATDHANGFYYKLQFHDGSLHIFYDKELELISKAERKK